MISLNVKKFKELQGQITETNMAKMLGISRTHLWRAKNSYGVGGEFIEGFKSAFPKKKIEEYFYFTDKKDLLTDNDKKGA